MRRRVLQITLTELRLIFREPAWPITFTLVPLGLMVVLDRGMYEWLVVHCVAVHGCARAVPKGAELSVGGLAGLNSITLLANFGLFFYRDYSTGVWDRLRATLVSPREIMLGKLTATWIAHFAQFAVLVLLAQAIFGVPVSGHLLPLAALIACTVTAVVAFGFAMFSFYKSSNAFEATAVVGGVLLGALGGGFSPRELLPAWAKAIDWISPVRWTVAGFRYVLIDRDPRSIAGPCAVLCLFALVFTIAGIARFDPSESKAKNR